LTVNISAKNLKALPILRNLDVDKVSYITMLAKQLFGLKSGDQQRFDSIQNQIDQAMYKLYGISDDEISLIERPVKD
jgi:hypothetical protein